MEDYPKKSKGLAFPINKIAAKFMPSKLRKFSCLPWWLKKMSLNPV